MVSRAASCSNNAPASHNPLHVLLPGVLRAALPALSTSHRTSGSREAAARHAIAGRSSTRFSSRGAGLFHRRQPRRQRPSALLWCSRRNARATPPPPAEARRFAELRS
ncbi:hypothetical protein NDU88_007027 [Pleurodeles waltl]|uniref:Uncharacterized protein n=1 Tax=Pleurodeles waltl TaxID=8319 RepID=A0AAV7NV62_PLEWA|nr:hypothetical protein NDU88_007027 [Pleurodeles waltl]